MIRVKNPNFNFPAAVFPLFAIQNKTGRVFLAYMIPNGVFRASLNRPAASSSSSCPNSTSHIEYSLAQFTERCQTKTWISQIEIGPLASVGTPEAICQFEMAE